METVYFQAAQLLLSLAYPTQWHVKAEGPHRATSGLFWATVCCLHGEDTISWAASGHPSCRPVPGKRRLCLLLQHAARTPVPLSASRSTGPGEETAPLLPDSHLTCCKSMKTSPTGGDSPAAILVQDLRAWAKYQPFSFTGRHPANLESGITCGERAGQGNVVGDCWPLPSTPWLRIQRSPRRPLENLPGITRTGLSPAACRGKWPNPRCFGHQLQLIRDRWDPVLLWKIRGADGDSSYIELLHGLCKRKKSFLLSHIYSSTAVQSWGVIDHQGKKKSERSGAGSTCQEQAAVVLWHLALIAQIPKTARRNHRESCADHSDSTRTNSSSFKRHTQSNTPYRQRGQPSGCRSVPCRHWQG